MALPDPYRLLGIEPEASAEEVRAAFRRKVRQNHPDTATEDDESADVQEIIEAYRLLIDPNSRARHDHQAHGREGGIGGRRVRVTHRDSETQAGSGRSRVCRLCSGSGTETEEVVCPGCGGRAEITALDGDRARVVRCRRCIGHGRMMVSHECRACGGSGTTSD